MEPVIKLNAGVTKWDIRQKVWDYIEANNLANFPRPVHNRIPNFKGSYQACEYIKCLEIFNRTKEVKVDPDKPLEGVRLAVLQARKTLLVPTPRLRTGLFNNIIPPQGATKDILRICATSQGVKDYSVPIGLDAKVRVDLVVVGSVAVSEKGWRIGKGEGFADLEYAMMASMGAVNETTATATIVHDCQVVDIPEELLDDHDLTIDYILTPTRLIKTDCKRPKPQGIMWAKVSHEMMARIPILKNLWYREKQKGKTVSLKDELVTPNKEKGGSLEGAKPVANDNQQIVTKRSMNIKNEGSPPKMNANSPVKVHSSIVYVGNIPQSLRVSEFKNILRERDASPQHLIWQGAQHRAFLEYKDEARAEEVVIGLHGLCIGESTLRVELAKSKRANKHLEHTVEKQSLNRR
ncbi:methenyltetrahydrofolate synthase domain-containing protein isoform X1 [Latimeria chalumnae]|uniref:Methenyltetrahydrofolate synthase domain-containing protein n=1 Tax=Latimeria chalumnae TaxID=7897 RepID=H3B1H7_LATCH|nr:PREDICTED: methenyltetrahydrofolate synthase domain-containing protein isoform X1 [Latimeria chalumnae]|eukprot:XP_005995945.1 PREDICTED: methenyltetrahydrofolate synthase domain-containing protein isoform X1 [Latimeria chalumnae]